ncbi:MAG: ABC transporter ATP-binding protein [Paracoccaceae bacterium]
MIDVHERGSPSRPDGESGDAPLLRVEGLDVRLHVGATSVHAVRSVDFLVRRGECVGVVGESGSGKSTLARAVMRLMPNVSRVELGGAIIFDGRDLMTLPGAEMRKLRRKSGFSMVFQDPLGFLNPTKRIWRQVAEALSERPGGDRPFARVVKLLEEVGLPEPERVAKRYPHELSGGMRQRVVIAIALASEPQLLFADEPTTALDSTVQLLVLDTLRRLHRDRGTGMVVITHDLSVVAELCDRVYVMRGGEVIESGATVDIFEAPEDPYTARLIELSRASHTLGAAKLCAPASG